MVTDLSDEIAIVTGAGSGIGRAVSKIFSDRGATVVGLDLRASPTDDGPTFDSVATGELVTGDVADPEDVARALKVAREYGAPTIAVNNAGVGSNGRIDEVEPAAWRRSFDVHVTGTYNVCRAILPEMAESGTGSVVNVSSLWGIRGFGSMADYGAAKGAIVNLTRQLAVDFSPDGVRVNAVAPGFVKTSMNEDVWREDREPAAGRASIETVRDRTLVPWLGEPEDVGELVAFLAGDGARFITGQVIAVDGGWSAW